MITELTRLSGATPPTTRMSKTELRLEVIQSQGAKLLFASGVFALIALFAPFGFKGELWESHGSIALSTVMGAIAIVLAILGLKRYFKRVDTLQSELDNDFCHAVSLGDMNHALGLLDHGANINSRDKNGRGPLDMAIIFNRGNVMVEWLMERKAASSKIPVSSAVTNPFIVTTLIKRLPPADRAKFIENGIDAALHILARDKKAGLSTSPGVIRSLTLLIPESKETSFQIDDKPLLEFVEGLKFFNHQDKDDLLKVLRLHAMIEPGESRKTILNPQVLGSLKSTFPKHADDILETWTNAVLLQISQQSPEPEHHLNINDLLEG